MAIITTIGATKSAINAAKSVYKAPEELESLQNDLSDAEVMIRDIKSYTEEDSNPASPQKAALQDRLTAAEGIVMQLKTLILEVLENPDDPASSVRRIAWLKAKKKTRKLRKKLAQIHEDLPRRHDQAEGARITLGLRNISSVQLKMSAGLSRLEGQVDATSRSVSQLRGALMSTQDLQDQTISSLEDLRQDTTQRLESLESAISTSNNLLQILPEILNLQIQTSQQTSTLTSSSEATANTITSTVQSTYQSIMIQSRYQNPNSCESSCHCQCHTPKTLNSPSFLSNLLGHIFIGYKGVPALANKCTDQRCQRDSQPKVYLNYYFPQWWVVERIVMLLGQWTTARGPELLIRFPRRIGENSAVFKLADSGNTEGLKLLFKSGRASPNDLDVTNSGVVNRAFHKNSNFDTVKFLIQAGADTQVEDSTGRTFEDIVCMKVFVGRNSLEWTQWGMENFVSRRNQHFAFSSLHEVILKLRHTSIEEEISRHSENPGSIDAQDVWGRTPLHWAAVRGNLEAVYQLLQSGADPNIPDNCRLTALHLSSTYGKLDCAINLLHHGANPQSFELAGWTALHFICAYTSYQPSRARSIEILNTMFHFGVDINAQNKSGYSSLHLSVQAPESGSNTHLKWLLAHGADHRLKSSSGRTILHQMGEHANLESVQILRGAHLCGIDVNARLYDTGGTAMDEILDPYRETPASEELIKSFQVLLDEIEARTNGQMPCACDVHKNKGSTILPNTCSMPGEFPTLSEDSADDEISPNNPPSIFRDPSTSTKSAETFDKGSDSEDEPIFKDSVEYQIPTML